MKTKSRGRKKLTSLEQWQSATTAIQERYRTTGLFQLNFLTQTQQKIQRKYLSRPSQIITETEIIFDFELDQNAVKRQIDLFGWRVYVTNQTDNQLSLKQAVCAYRDEYLIERSFARLKGFPLSLTPIYLQREDHITGLIRLLSIGLRVLTLLEFQVRRCLEQEQQQLQGLFIGNPQRRTERPTASLILAVFKEITLLLIDVNNQVYAHLTALSPLQQRLLVLLGFPITIYTQLDGQSFTPG